MIHTIAEFLFSLTGGVPIVATGWAFLYFGIVAIIALGLLFLFLLFLDGDKSDIFVGFAILLFVWCLIFGIGAPITQKEMMYSFCEPVIYEVGTDKVTEKMVADQCLLKDNYYGVRGEWVLIKE